MITTKLPGRLFAALVAVLLLAAACSGDDTDVSTATTTTTTDIATSGDTGATISSNLQLMRGAYEFDTRIEASGSPVTQVAGRNVEGNSQFTTTTGSGATLEIVSVAGVIWTSLDSGASWTEQGTEDLSSDPIGPLLKPGAITDSGEQITATYPGAILGLPDASIDVNLRADGEAVELVYETESVTVRTRLSPAADATPIGAPTAG